MISRNTMTKRETVFVTYVMTFETIHNFMCANTLMTEEARAMEAFRYGHRFGAFARRTTLARIVAQGDHVRIGQMFIRIL